MGQMHRVFDCIITDIELCNLIEHFVPERDAYYFIDDELMWSLLKAGITVYSREELHASFPTFGVEYNAVYSSWNIPKNAYVVLLNQRQLDKVTDELRHQLFSQQVKLNRGHVYDLYWFDTFEQLNEFERLQQHTVTVENKWYYVLTCDDWWTFTDEIRKQWVLKWLMQWNKDDPSCVVDFPRDHNVVSYALIDEYAGTYTGISGPNCFAATIAMVVAGRNRDLTHSRVLIKQWLHYQPFFRLLAAQGYSKITKYHAINELQSIYPADVLVWHTSDGTAAHAVFAVTNELIFQKHGQGFQDPWRVLRIEDVWYNECLKSGGYITVYRKIDA